VVDRALFLVAALASAVAIAACGSSSHDRTTSTARSVSERARTRTAEMDETFTPYDTSATMRPPGCSRADVREARKRARLGRRLIGCAHATLTPGH
jgi:hypothetical protein